MKIVFMGTPDFAVPILDKLVKNNYNIVAVITAPDKPSGRGLKMSHSAVKQYALEHQLHVLQPEKLKNNDFVNELRALEADLQIVVAFRMLPEVVWKMPPKGTFNLHASLLPQYRGAAPINYAIINGEKTTGVTTFFLSHEIDTGNVIMQQTCTIGPDETAGELHDKLMHLGSETVLKTVQLIEKNEAKSIPQQQLMVGELKVAHKIFKDDCNIVWDNDALTLHNFIRGLSPFPTAFTNLIFENSESILFKIYKAAYELTSHSKPTGSIESDGKTFLKVACKNGFINLLQVQMAGKKAMTIQEFLRGFDVNKIKMMGT
ncbi:MAG TPA: methionyl-tRNA formyltransferase [Bacteroidia bacterium]|nr:methionyl-tRNA formyltransferase [Bacteroidia bacterium]